MGFWLGTSILSFKVTPLTMKTMHWLSHNESSKEMMNFFSSLFEYVPSFQPLLFEIFLTNQKSKIKSVSKIKYQLNRMHSSTFASSPTLFWCRWNERTGFNVHQAPWSQQNRPEENHWLYLHSQVVTQHGESAGHTRGSKLLTDPSCTGLLQSFSHIWGKDAAELHITVYYTVSL